MAAIRYTTLRSRNERRRQPEARLPQRPSADALARQAEVLLKIVDRSAEMGAAEQPAAEALEPCALEVEIDGLHSDKANEAVERAMASLAQMSELEARLHYDADELTFDDVVHRLKGDLRGAEPDAKREMKPLVAERVRSMQQMELFRTVQRLFQDVHWRPSVLVWVALLLCGPVVEGLTSAGLFGEGDALGGFGGWMTAMLLGLANAAVGVALAYGAALAGHRRSTVRKALGLALVVSAFLGGIAANLFAAHWRLAMVRAPANPLDFVQSTLAADPFAPMLDMKAVALFLVSALFIGFVAWETTRTWGSYPGYRDHGMRERNAERRLRRMRRDLGRRIGRRGDDAKAALDARVEAVKTKAAFAKDLLSDAMICVSGYDNEVEAIRTSHERSHLLFRETNRRVRSPSPAPDYFSERPVLQAQSVTLPDIYLKKADAMARTAQEILGQTGLALEAIDAAVAAAAERLDNLELEVEATVMREERDARRRAAPHGRVYGQELLS